MKRAFLLIGLSMASFGSAFFAGACVGDEPGPLPVTPGPDAGDEDTYRPPFDAGDAGPALPKTIRGLALWLDGDDSDSVLRKPGGDATVTKWLDKSGTVPPRDFAAVEGTGAPKFAPGSMNDNRRHSVFFLNSGFQYLKGPSFSGLQGAEAFIVFQTVQIHVPQDSGKPTYGLWLFSKHGSFHPEHSDFLRESFGSVSASGHTPILTNAIPPERLYDPRIFGVVSSPGKYKGYSNGAPLPTNLGDSTFGFPTEGSLIGASNVTRTDIQPEAWFNGYIAEVLIYDQELPKEDHDAVQSYLSTKWGIALKDGGT